MTIDVEAFVEFEAAGFSSRAAAYQRHFGDVTGQFADPLLDAAGVGEGSRVLDVASGPGQVAARAAARGASVAGVDVSDGMVELARRLHPDIEFRAGDAHRLADPDRSYDAAVANLAVPHLADHARAVAEMRRVLVEGGRLALSTWDLPDRSPFPGAMFLAVQEAAAPPVDGLPAGPSFYAYADDDAFARLLADAGLVDVEVREAGFTYRAPSVDAAWESLLEGTVRASALVRGQTAAVRDEIRAAFDRVVAAYATAGGLELPIVIKIASGRRPLG
jgi:ubiquinone/menaquinone biosynthesis C-methylase UbiE